jgi:hypothetical protein
MHTIAKAGVSLLVGVAGFVVVTVGVTEALAPHVWPALMLGLPAGAVAGVVGAALAFVGLTARAERRETGSVSTRTARRLWATLAAAAAGVVVGVSTVAILATQAVGLATAILLGGVPAALVAAAVAALLVVRRYRREPPRGTTPQ